MAPDVVLERRDVEVADDDGAARRLVLVPEPGRHLVDEGELVGELVVDRRVRLVAAGGDVEIVDLQALRLAAERRLEVARIALGAEIARARGDDRQPRDDRDAVIALLAVERDMRIAERRRNSARGKLARRGTWSPAGTARRAAARSRYRATRPRRRRTELMFQVAIEKRSRRGRANMAASGRKRRATCPQGRSRTGGSSRSRDSSMWNNCGSGLLVRSTLNRVTTVWKPCASITVHCFSAKLSGSNTSATSAAPPKVALSSISIVAALSSDRDALDRGVLGEVDVVGEQELQRRLGDEIEILGVELLIAHRDRAPVGDDLEPRGRIEVEQHPPRPAT